MNSDLHKIYHSSWAYEILRMLRIDGKCLVIIKMYFTLFLVSVCVDTTWPIKWFVIGMGNWKSNKSKIIIAFEQRFIQWESLNTVYSLFSTSSTKKGIFYESNLVLLDPIFIKIFIPIRNANVNSHISPIKSFCYFGNSPSGHWTKKSKNSILTFHFSQCSFEKDSVQY